MKSLRKTFFILKSQGIRALARRTTAKVSSSLRALADRRRRNRAWSQAVQLVPVAGSVTISPQRSDAPEVSIIIPVYGKDRFTYNCLRTLAGGLVDVSAEVIIVDDGSPASTKELLDSVHGVRRLRNDQNLGYIASCNLGARAAKGEFLAFLNNDTLPQRGWLSALVARKRADVSIGAVGSKLLYPNRTISEAGSIIWSDGSGWNFGRGFDEEDPACNYVRNVDYCSSASLLIERRRFLELGGFDARYAPAYYEDVDFSFTLRSQGLRTVFEPRSVVVHFEGGTAGMDERTGAKRFQPRNRPLFLAKWRAQIQAHYPPEPRQARAAARRLSGALKILVIDRFVPFSDRDAGSMRLLNLLLLMKELDCDVTFAPAEGIAHEPYAQQLRDRGIEVLGKTKGSNADRQLRERRGIFDAAWICRPDICARYAPLLRSWGSRIWYDTVDLHFLRLQRQEAVSARRTSWRKIKKLEIELAKGADAAIVTSPVERQLLAEQGVAPIYVIPPVQPQVGAVAPWEARAGVLFIGNYTHQPNVDAAVQLANEIFPLMAAGIPGLKLTLAGNEPPPEVLKLRSDAISVTGHLDNLNPLLQRARVFVAPLRFGSGVKGKLLQSMAHGIPIVTTTIGAEGLPLEHSVSACIADATETLASYATELYLDADRWRGLSETALRLVARYEPNSVREALRDLITTLDAQASTVQAAK